MVIVVARSRAGFFPIGSAFPGLWSGRRPHCRFRGLLKLYACYGPPDCSPTMRGLCREVSISTVTRAHRSPAIESNHQLFVWVLPPLVISPFGAHQRPPALRQGHSRLHFCVPVAARQRLLKRRHGYAIPRLAAEIVHAPEFEIPIAAGEYAVGLKRSCDGAVGVDVVRAEPALDARGVVGSVHLHRGHARGCAAGFGQPDLEAPLPLGWM